MRILEFIGELSYLSLILMIFCLGWWPNSIDFETWLEWWLIRRYLVALVLMADHAALLGYPRMHVLLARLLSWYGCIFLLNELDREDLQLLFRGSDSRFTLLSYPWKCITRQGGATRGTRSRASSWGRRPTTTIGRTTAGASRFPTPGGASRCCW